MTLNRNSDLFINSFAKKNNMSRVIICKFCVKDYKLEELKIKIENGFVVIRGSHNEKRDEYSFVSRKFTRRVPMPSHLLVDDLEVKLFFNGILFITANVREVKFIIFYF